jgi:hypothetical protein
MISSFFRSSISVSLFFSFGGVVAVFLLYFFVSLFSSSSLCLFRLSSVEYPSTSLSSCFFMFFYAAPFPFSCFMCCLCQSSKGFSSNFFLLERKTYLLFCFLPVTSRWNSVTPILTVYFTLSRLVPCFFFWFFH